MTEEEFRERFRKSPIKRAKRRGLLRNVAVALGTGGSPAVPALVAALEDEEPGAGACGVGAGADWFSRFR